VDVVGGSSLADEPVLSELDEFPLTNLSSPGSRGPLGLGGVNSGELRLDVDAVEFSSFWPLPLSWYVIAQECIRAINTLRPAERGLRSKGKANVHVRMIWGNGDYLLLRSSSPLRRLVKKL